MTKQEYYDLLVQAARDGTFPAREKGNCYYRKDQNPKSKKRCAIGLLIADKKYKWTMENKTINHKDVRENVELPEGLTIDDLESIQEEHDNMDTGKEFIREINQMYCFRDVDLVAP